MTILSPDAQLRRHQHWIVIATLITALHVTDDLPLHTNHFRGRIQGSRSTIRPLNRPKLPTRYPLFKLLSHLVVRGLSHAAVYRRLQDCAFVLNCGAFEDVIAGISHRLLRCLLRLHFMVLSLCLCDDTICLMSESSSQVAVLLQHLLRRMDLLAVACAMSSYLCCARALSSNLL